VYAREIDGKTYTFGIAGSLILNGQVLYDHETGSDWAQLPGVSVTGPMEGTRLEYLPSWQTTWAEWLRRYPDTTAVDKEGVSEDRNTAYYTSDQIGIYGETRRDARLSPKALLIGVDWGGEQTAYPVDELRAQPIVNDMLGGADVLVVYIPETQTHLVYDRRVDGLRLTFRATDQPLVLTDTDTGSLWDAWTGTAISGLLDGAALKRIPSTLVFWFSWKDWHPSTYLFAGN
jgi:hypothetical protein